MENYRSDLDFVIDVTENKGYKTSKKYVKQTYDSFMEKVRDDVFFNKKTDLSHFNITTKHLARSSVLNSYYWAVIDCDSHQNIDFAIEALNGQNVSYCLITSSYRNTDQDNRYWIICDKCAIVKELIDFMASIPGNDTLYVSCCRDKSIVNLRAYPKNFCLPIFVSMPNQEKCSEDFWKWISAFKDYWYSEDIRNILRQMIILQNKQDYVRCIGNHFSPETKYFLKNLYGIKEDQHINPVKNCLYGLEV